MILPRSELYLDVESFLGVMLSSGPKLLYLEKTRLVGISSQSCTICMQLALPPCPLELSPRDCASSITRNQHFWNTSSTRSASDLVPSPRVMAFIQ